MNDTQIIHYIRDEIPFAGIRKSIQKREDIAPMIKKVKEHCKINATGPLTLIFRFDTPVDGFDAEIGYPINEIINKNEIKTTTLPKMHFFSIKVKGTIDEVRKASILLRDHMNTVGLSSELEFVEKYIVEDAETPENNITEVQRSFLHWSEVYKENLFKFLNSELANQIWGEGDKITPFTLVDERVKWVANTVDKLKMYTNQDLQFKILSKVALKRPKEEINKYKQLFKETGDINKVFYELNRNLENTSTGGFLEKPRIENNLLKLSKVPMNRKEYDQAMTNDEKRRAFCFCSLIREAKAPKVDPIFCYRAAGWDRQLWEEVLDVSFEKCKVTKSILKNDNYCAWEYSLPDKTILSSK
jgi:effector-binding domain-containing protein